MVKKIFICFIIWKIIIYAITPPLTHIIPDAPFFQAKNIFSERYHELIWRFANFDGITYVRTARNGYNTGTIPFFPLYPLTIRFFASFFSYKYFTPISQIISNVSLLAALYIFYKLLQIDGKKRLFSTLIVLLFIFPTSFFYGASYNDSIFLLFASLCIYFMRKNLIIIASFFGVLSSLTRLNGLALFPMLISEFIARNNKITYGSEIKWSLSHINLLIKNSFSFKKIIKSKIYFSLLIPLTLLSYLLYIHIRFGDWHILFSSMTTWHQDKFVVPFQVFWRYFKIIILYPTFQLTYWIAVFEITLILFYIFLMIYSYNRIRFSYLCFFVISILIPASTGTFQGMPRYGLHLYPFFLALAIFISSLKRYQKIFYYLTSVLLLIIMLGLFTNGYFVS